jgi:hypothetical protein
MLSFRSKGPIGEIRRAILLHQHIFKNAGSTLDWILKRNFGERLASWDMASTASRMTTEWLQKFLDKNKHIQAFSSHQLHGQTLNIRNYAFLDMMFFRHPLDRLRSIFDFYRRYDLPHPLVGEARAHDLAGFLRVLVEQYPHQANDVQVNLLSRAGTYQRPPDTEDLRRACARMRELAVPGLLEQFDESLVAAEYFIRPTFGALDFSYQSQNVSSARQHDQLSARLDELRTQCGEHLYGQLEALNALDIEFHEAVQAEIRRRTALIPDFEQKLTEFSARCANLVIAGP